MTKTRGKITNRAAHIFIVGILSGHIARVHSSVRLHLLKISSYYGLFLQILTFTSHLPTHEECTPVRFLFAVYSRSAGFIRTLFARLRIFQRKSRKVSANQPFSNQISVNSHLMCLLRLPAFPPFALRVLELN